MQNGELQNRFLQPIQDSGRHGEKNPRIFLKAKVIQAFSQLNPDRDKILNFLDNRSRTRNSRQFSGKSYTWRYRGKL